MQKPKKGRSVHSLFGGKPQIAPGVNPGVTVDQLKPLLCKCGNALFLQASNVYYASPLQAVSGGPTLVQVPLGFYCSTCEKINEFDVSGLPAFQSGAAPEGEQKH